jgi:hypothetical protein
LRVTPRSVLLTGFVRLQGFYEMPKDDANQCLSNTTLLPALLRDMGYRCGSHILIEFKHWPNIGLKNGLLMTLIVRTEC